MDQDLDLRELLPYIDPADLNYQDWLNVGLALHQEGYDCAVWDEWSRNDSRFHVGECTIDRINVDGNYCPWNCRWVDAKTQANNKRPRRE